MKNVDISTNLKKSAWMEIFGSEERTYPGNRGRVVAVPYVIFACCKVVD